MSKIFKWIGIVVVALIVVSLVANLFSGKSTAKSSDATSGKKEPASTSEHQNSWVTVYSFKGNGKKKSSSFELSGNEAKIEYDYKAGANGGIFSAYILEKGVDLMDRGGIPEVMITKSENSETSIQKSAGAYYLDINAVGDWNVSVLELK